VVVEPGHRSFQTASQVKKLAADLGIAHVYMAGNKVGDEADAALIREHANGLPFLGFMSLNDKIMEADRRNLSPYDIDDRIRAEVG